MSSHPRIGFIGAGNMASALAGGLLARGWPAASLWLADPSAAQLSAHSGRGLRTTTDNAELAAAVDVLVLSVKPQVMADVLKPIAGIARARRPLIISIAAGIPVASLQRWLGAALPVVRAMPNTPALVQAGAVGLSLWVEREDLIDAVTAVSGSGPAYFFYVMESMIAAGVALGLDERDARALTLQTALGAAQMAITADVGPAELRRRVTSPAGTTEQAVRVFDESGLGDIFQRALAACADRGAEMARELGGRD